MLRDTSTGCFKRQSEHVHWNYDVLEQVAPALGSVGLIENADLLFRWLRSPATGCAGNHTQAFRIVHVLGPTERFARRHSLSPEAKGGTELTFMSRWPWLLRLMDFIGRRCEP
jgi:hypothetical protein